MLYHGEFIMSYSFETYTLDSFLDMLSADVNTAPFRYWYGEFAICDVDQDGEPELIFALQANRRPVYEIYDQVYNAERYLILHYMNGSIYGYMQAFRTFQMLRANGLFSTSGGGGSGGTGSMRFDETGYERVRVCYRNLYGATDEEVEYIVNDTVVSHEEYLAFGEQMPRSGLATWFELSVDNLYGFFGE
jgi:hypothetical protein